VAMQGRESWRNGQSNVRGREMQHRDRIARLMRSRALLAIALAALGAGCASLPPQDGRTQTSALTDTAATRLGRAAAPLVAAHPGKSGIYAMPTPSQAFAARVLFAAVAEKSLDIQYYISHDDQTGSLLY